MPLWLHHLVASLSGPNFWAVVVPTLGGIWAIALVLSYYQNPPRLWIERFRKIEGLDHTGFFLELLFCVGVTYTCYHLAAVSWPAAGAAFRAGGWETWGAVVSLAGVAVVAIVQSLHTSGAEFPREIQEQYPHLYREFAADWENQVRGLRWQYGYYVFASVVGWWLLVVAAGLFLYGAIGDLGRLEQLRAELNTYALPVGEKLDEAQLQAGQRTLLAFTDYRENLLQVVNAALVPVGMFMVLFYLFLGTRYQDLYAPSTREYYRVVACFFILFCLPAIVIYGYVQLASASAEVTQQFQAVAQAALRGPVGPHLGELNELQNNLVERASVGGFLLRMASSWGGILVLAQFVLSGIARRVFRWSLFSNLVPRSLGGLSARLRAVLTRPDEPEEADDA